MAKKEKVIQAILSAVDELNMQLPKEKQLEKSVNTVLFGSSSKLDSLGLVDLILATEQKIEEEFESIVTLANEKAMSQKKSPFRTIGTLAEYICFLLDEERHE